MSTAAALRAVALLAALVLAGCEDPYAHDRTVSPGARTSLRGRYPERHRPTRAAGQDAAANRRGRA